MEILDGQSDELSRRDPDDAAVTRAVPLDEVRQHRILDQPDAEHFNRALAAARQFHQDSYAAIRNDNVGIQQNHGGIDSVGLRYAATIAVGLNEIVIFV